MRRSRILPLIALAALALQAHAELTELKVESTRSWLGGRFEKIQGRAHFALDPQNAANQGIADLALAPVNGAGRVEFESDFVIVRLADARKSRHSALIEIPNRGVTQANRSFFSTAAGSGFNLLKLDDTSLADSFVFMLLSRDHDPALLGEFQRPAKSDPGLGRWARAMALQGAAAALARNGAHVA